VTDGSALFTWTPDASQLGNHVVTFEVQDGSEPVGSDSEAVTITIGQVNAPPVLAPIGDRSVTAGEALALALGAQDPDGDALAFSAAGLPAGALLSDAHDGTGSLEWSPTAADVGTYDVTLSVADDGSPSESDSETFTVTVQPASAPSAVRIDDAHWKPGKRRGGKLHVRGSEAHPRESIGVLDADSGLVLGSKKANRRGGFALKLQPMIVPCEVQVQAGDVRSAPVPVRGAPADCGQAIQLEVEARWKCADPEHPAEDEDAGLRVHGEHAPAGAAIEIRDAASGGVLATAQADSAGRFEAQAAAPTPPRAIDVRVSAGGLDWSFDAVPVRAESCDDDDDGEAERAE
jgi:hypothetical protein